MMAVIFGYSVNDTTDITKVRPGGLLLSLIDQKVTQRGHRRGWPPAPVVSVLASSESGLGVFSHP